MLLLLASGVILANQPLGKAGNRHTRYGLARQFPRSEAAQPVRCGAGLADADRDADLFPRCVCVTVSPP